MHKIFRRRKRIREYPSHSFRDKKFPTGIHSFYKPNHPDIDIVFIHGLTGDRERTWTAETSTVPWPGKLLPERLGNARILTYGYDAYVADWRSVVSKSRIGNHAQNMLVALSNYRDTHGGNDIPLVFVCHSLGGLVCEDMLLSSRNSVEDHHRAILRNTRGILFLGTPHHGSGFAKWAGLLAKFIGVVKQTNPDIVQVLERDSEVLARIQTEFHMMLRNQTLGQAGQVPDIAIICFYEEMPLQGIGKVVVPMDSAILPAHTSVGIHADHIGMTKFDSADDPGFLSIAAELERIVGRARSVYTKTVEVSGENAETTTTPSTEMQGWSDIAPVHIGHIGDNFQSNVVYGGSQCFQGNVNIGA